MSAESHGADVLHGNVQEQSVRMLAELQRELLWLTARTRQVRDAIKAIEPISRDCPLPLRTASMPSPRKRARNSGVQIAPVPGSEDQLTPLQQRVMELMRRERPTPERLMSSAQIAERLQTAKIGALRKWALTPLSNFGVKATPRGYYFEPVVDGSSGPPPGP